MKKQTIIFLAILLSSCTKNSSSTSTLPNATVIISGKTTVLSTGQFLYGISYNGSKTSLEEIQAYTPSGNASLDMSFYDYTGDSIQIEQPVTMQLGDDGDFIINETFYRIRNGSFTLRRKSAGTVDASFSGEVVRDSIYHAGDSLLSVGATFKNIPIAYFH